MSKQETVELTFKIPKPIMDFFEAYWRFQGWKDQTAKEYLIEHTSDNIPSLIYDVVFSRTEMSEIDEVLENHGLEQYKELMGLPKRKETTKP